MDRILIELTAEGEGGNVHSDIDINGATIVRVASYIYSILEELSEMDEEACKMAIGTFIHNKAKRRTNQCQHQKQTKTTPMQNCAK